MSTMTLAQKDLEIVTKHIQKVFPILREPSSSDATTPSHDNHLLELRYQREILEKIMHQMDKRFEQMDKRFEQMDKRFEQMDKRFEQMDKRFEQMDKRFAEAREAANRRFAEAREAANRRFAESREETNRQIKYLQWMIGIGFGAVTTIMPIVVSIVVSIVLKSL